MGKQVFASYSGSTTKCLMTFACFFCSQQPEIPYEANKNIFIYSKWNQLRVYLTWKSMGREHGTLPQCVQVNCMDCTLYIAYERLTSIWNKRFIPSFLWLRFDRPTRLLPRLGIGTSTAHKSNSPSSFHNPSDLGDIGRCTCLFDGYFFTLAFDSQAVLVASTIPSVQSEFRHTHSRKIVWLEVAD